MDKCQKQEILRQRQASAVEDVEKVSWINIAESDTTEWLTLFYGLKWPGSFVIVMRSSKASKALFFFNEWEVRNGNGYFPVT